jgi:hypothetical protein
VLGMHFRYGQEKQDGGNTWSVGIGLDGIGI